LNNRKEKEGVRDLMINTRQNSGSRSGGGFSPRGRMISGKKLDAIRTDVCLDMAELELIKRCVTEHGKIQPARISGISAKQQRRIKQIVKRARTMGLFA